MKQFFNFETGKEFNPAKTLNYFFISPFFQQNAKILNLEKRVKDDLGNDFGFIWYNGIPVPVFPISVLDLGKCMIKWDTTENGVIYSGNRRIYFRFYDENTVRLDTVL